MTAALSAFFRMLPRVRMGPASRVAVGLCSLMIACVLIVDFVVGVMPDQRALLRQLRERISEQVAMQVVGAVGSGDPRAVHRLLPQILDKDPELVSLGIRRSDGQLAAQAGPHASHWGPSSAGRSDLDHVAVVLNLNDQRWGELELSFKPHMSQSAWSWLTEPRVFLVLILGVGGFVLFTLYLRRVFHYLDPSAVIPDRVRAAFDGFAEGVMVVDAAGRIILANASLRRWVEREGTSLHGQRIQNIPWLRGSLPQDAREYPWMRAMALNAPQKGEHLEFPQESGGSIRTVVNCSPIQEGDSRVRGCIVTFDDVSELERINTQLRSAMEDVARSREQIEKQNEDLRVLAMRDGLTGVLNRRAFFEQIEPMFAAARAGNQPLCCIMSDIDHFKSINDRFGHATGDRVLKVVARALSGGVREPDLLGRYGGEEFCIALPGTGLDEACMVAERLRIEIENRAGKGVRSTPGLVVTSSFGVSTLDPSVADPLDLIDRADKALYHSKESGRNRVTRAAPAT
jgi:diguanylate cyclase (GGDEF)-like protein